MQFVAEETIRLLNRARMSELYAIYLYKRIEYSLRARNYGRLARNFHEIAEQEMRHAQQLAERILDIDRTAPIVSEYERSTILIEESPVGDLLELAQDTELETLNTYSEIVPLLGDDVVSRKLVERIMEQEQEHYNYFDDNAYSCNELGAVYLAEKI